MARILLDTNVLVYFYDHNSPEKQKQARLIIERLSTLKNGYISAQNLAEFVSATLRKLKPSFTPAEALDEASLLASSLQVFDLTPQIVLEAARGVRDHQFSYYDAQIWATARLNQIPFVFSEDFQDGQTLEGVKFADPFAESFRADEWF
ncbi:MAG: PIN domain-containing protein [Anaerolineales bacterium]